MKRMLPILALLAMSSFALAPTAAFAIHEGWASTQGGSTNECRDNPGCTEQPRGQVDKDLDNNAPCDGPPGQCK